MTAVPVTSAPQRIAATMRVHAANPWSLVITTVCVAGSIARNSDARNRSTFVSSFRANSTSCA